MGLPSGICCPLSSIPWSRAADLVKSQLYCYTPSNQGQFLNPKSSVSLRTVEMRSPLSSRVTVRIPDGTDGKLSRPGLWEWRVLTRVHPWVTPMCLGGAPASALIRHLVWPGANGRHWTKPLVIAPTADVRLDGEQTEACHGDGRGGGWGTGAWAGSAIWSMQVRAACQHWGLVRMCEAVLLLFLPAFCAGSLVC